MTEYDNACIYKIVLNGIRDEDFYIGSTINFNQRLDKHKKDALKNNSKFYKSIRANGGNFIMCKLYDFPCKNELELRIEERKAYDLYKPTLNTRRPYITDDERKEKHTETSKNYYHNNKDKINDKKNDYYQINKDKIKEYYQNNKDKLNKQKKEYYQNNKDKLNEIIRCNCGCMINRQYLKRHQTTNKHIKLMRQ